MSFFFESIEGEDSAKLNLITKSIGESISFLTLIAFIESTPSDLTFSIPFLICGVAQIIYEILTSFAFNFERKRNYKRTEKFEEIEPLEEVEETDRGQMIRDHSLDKDENEFT